MFADERGQLQANAQSVQPFVSFCSRY